MKNIIFCFSATGNSLSVSKELEKKLSNTEIYPMLEENKILLKNKYNTIGFIFPVYGGGMPNVVKNFIDTLDYSKNKTTYIFTINTYGGFPGNILQYSKKVFEQNNLKLNYSFNFKTYENYLIEYEMIFNEKLLDEEFLIQIKEITKNISEKNETDFLKLEKNQELENYTRDYLLSLKNRDENFLVSNSCIGCENCKNICFVKNIIMENNKPKFLKNCEFCLGCIHHCPTKSINYLNKTQNKERFHNKKIPFNTLLEFNNKIGG